MEYCTVLFTHESIYDHLHMGTDLHLCSLETTRATQITGGFVYLSAPRVLAHLLPDAAWVACRKLLGQSGDFKV
jgi:hypothetical protein